MAEKKNILEIRDLHKNFYIKGQKLEVLSGVNLNVQDGELVAIVGASGCGKSTLLKMIAGEEEPDEGQIVCQNGLRIAYLPQNPPFPEGMTLSEYIGEDESRWKVQSNLSRLGMEEYEMKLEQLSGGQRRKAALAKVLAAEFDLLLLDVRMAGLDGMALAAELKDRPARPDVVLISVDRDMALQGYHVDARRYLAKPVEPEQLREALLFCYGEAGKRTPRPPWSPAYHPARRQRRAHGAGSSPRCRGCARPGAGARQMPGADPR